MGPLQVKRPECILKHTLRWFYSKSTNNVAIETFELVISYNCNAERCIVLLTEARMFCSRLVDFVNININYGNVQTIALDLFSV